MNYDTVNIITEYLTGLDIIKLRRVSKLFSQIINNKCGDVIDIAASVGVGNDYLENALFCILINAIKNNNVTAIKWILTVNNLSVIRVDDKLFFCFNNPSLITSSVAIVPFPAKFTNSNFILKHPIRYVYNNQYKLIGINDCFVHACLSGFMELAKLILTILLSHNTTRAIIEDTFRIPIRSDGWSLESQYVENMFQQCCENGHIEMAKWLLDAKIIRKKWRKKTYHDFTCKKLNCNCKGAKVSKYSFYMCKVSEAAYKNYCNKYTSLRNVATESRCVIKYVIILSNRVSESTMRTNVIEFLLENIEPDNFTKDICTSLFQSACYKNDVELARLICNNKHLEATRVPAIFRIVCRLDCLEIVKIMCENKVIAVNKDNLELASLYSGEKVSEWMYNELYPTTPFGKKLRYITAALHHIAASIDKIFD